MSQLRFQTLIGDISSYVVDSLDLLKKYLNIITYCQIRYNRNGLFYIQMNIMLYQIIFLNWTKFKEIIDPFNKKIELWRVEQFFQQFNNSKINQENKPPTSILQDQTKKTVNIQDRSYSTPQTQIIIINEDYENKLKEIADKINKTFYQNNTHLNILLKMNNTTQEARNKLELNNNNQRNTFITRRKTDYYSFKPINIQ